mgnify:CR=1 FL=1
MIMVAMRMMVVITGTPRTTLDMNLGACFWWARPVMTRPAPKRSALMADKAAVMTTKLSKPAAQETPRVLKIWTKGDCSPVMSRHGVIMRMTAMAST